ncbi:hypothetical protein D9M69_641650 [compost metagenome]
MAVGIFQGGPVLIPGDGDRVFCIKTGLDVNFFGLTYAEILQGRMNAGRREDIQPEFSGI